MWLRIEPAANAEVKLLWGNDYGPHEPYFVGQGMLQECCELIRRALEELVMIEAGQQSGVRAKALRKLARCGADLHYALFEDIKIRDLATVVKDDMHAKYARDNKLRIIGHPAIHVPWALVFEGDAGAIPATAETVDDFAGFWGQKYGLSSTLSGYMQPPLKLERKLADVKMLSLMHEIEAGNAYDRFSDTFKSLYKGLMAHPVGVAHSKESCRALIEQAVSHDTIFHFFGHQADGELDLGLGEDGNIGVLEFKRLLDRLAEQKDASRPYGLVMLNACETAGGKMDYSFTNAADRPGLCGAISTETVVPRDYAARFAISFLVNMFDKGKSVGETMTALRHDVDLWPLSLVYGCYAQPDYRFSA